MATDLTQTICLGEITGLAPRLYTEPVDPGRTALILVDMQGRDIGESMHVADVDVGAMRAALAGCQKLLAAARACGLRVVHVILGSWTLDGGDLSPHKQRANALYRSQGADPQALRAWDSEESQVYPSLAPIQGEVVMQKTSGSAFATTGLATILHNMRICYTVFAGKLTDGCLGLTASAAADHAFDVTVVDGATYGSTRAAHLAMLRFFDQHWGRVRTVEQITEEFAAAPPAQ